MKKIIFYALVFWVFGFMLEYWYYRFMPVSHFMWVEKVVPTSDSFGLWTKPEFLTYADYKTPAKITWVDIQYCREYMGDYKYYSYYESSTYYKKPKNVQGWKWKYWIEWPNVPMQCYLYTVFSMHLMYWIIKNETHISQEYKYE